MEIIKEELLEVLMQTSQYAGIPAAVEALQIWYDMVYTYKIADPNVASREATVPYQDFLDGKVAMTLMNPWGMGFMTEDTVIGDNWAIVPLPQVNPDAPVNPLYAYYWSLNAQTTDALESVYARIDELEKTETEGVLYTRYRELFAWALVPGLALLLGVLVLRAGRASVLP